MMMEFGKLDRANSNRAQPSLREEARLVPQDYVVSGPQRWAGWVRVSVALGLASASWLAIGLTVL